jgi:hypothetical protein
LDRKLGLDFHACRVAYINLVLDSGVSLKEAQALARHATPEMTMNVYGRMREDHLSDAVEKVAESIIPQPKCVSCVYQQVVGLEQENATPLIKKGVALFTNGGGGGNRTTDRRFHRNAKPLQNLRKTQANLCVLKCYKIAL